MKFGNIKRDCDITTDSSQVDWEMAVSFLTYHKKWWYLNAKAAYENAVCHKCCF